MEQYDTMACYYVHNTYLFCFQHVNQWCFFLLGILHKGSGENQFLSQQPAVITSIMGNGRRRSISCPSCNGLAEGNKLLAPVALAVGIDGSLFVGDFNYIRRIFPSRNVTSILELRWDFNLDIKVSWNVRQHAFINMNFIVDLTQLRTTKVLVYHKLNTQRHWSIVIVYFSGLFVWVMLNERNPA